MTVVADVALSVLFIVMVMVMQLLVAVTPAVTLL